jgi:DeoR family myo-inositol catabolism operon transcriptional repressor
MKKYNINKTFMSTSGISEYGNLTNSSMLEYEVKQAAIKCSSKNYLLADSTKLGKTALLTYANIREMTTFITDSKISEKFLKLCQEEGVKTLYV